MSDFSQLFSQKNHALEQMKKQNYGLAEEILQTAQIKAEEKYIQGED